MVSAPRVLAQLVREHVAAQVAALAPALTQHLTAVVANNPLRTAGEILARQDVVALRESVVASVRAEVIREIAAGHTAGVLLGGEMAKKEFAELGIPMAPAPFQRGPSYLESVVADVRRAFTDFTEDLGAHVAQVFATANADPRAANFFVSLAHARAALIPDAVQVAARRLSARAQASASVTPIRAAAWAKLRIYRAFETANPGLTVVKEWRTTSAQPCPVCVALNGTQVPLDDEFDHGDGRLRVYRDLQCPPRHPNCRCVLILVIAPVEQQVVAQAHAEPPVPPRLTSEEIRDMPTPKYRALIGFLRAVLKAARRLIGRG